MPILLLFQKHITAQDLQEITDAIFLANGEFLYFENDVTSRIIIEASENKNFIRQFRKAYQGNMFVSYKILMDQ